MQKKGFFSILPEKSNKLTLPKQFLGKTAFVGNIFIYTYKVGPKNFFNVEVMRNDKSILIMNKKTRLDSEDPRDHWR